MKAAAWTASPPDQQERRSVYAYTKRGLLSPMAVAFDFMDTSLPCGQRDVTLVPPQALALLNNEFTHDRSLGLANMLASLPGSLEHKVDLAWQKSLGRDPTAQEKEQAVRHLQVQKDRFSSMLDRLKETRGSQTPVVDGLVLHLSAAQGVEHDNSGRVLKWQDLSGHGHHASQKDPAARPFLTNSGAGPKPRVNFDGKRNFLDLEGGQLLTSGAFSIFAVVRDAGHAGHRTLFSNWNGASGNSTSSVFLGTTAQATVRLSDDFTSPQPLSRNDGFFLLSAIAAPQETSIFQGANVLARKGSGLAARRLDTEFVIGQQGNIQGEWWDGDLAEILVYDRALTDAERVQLTGELQTRHSLSQPQMADPETLALASLCHVLLNTNEFLYID